MPELNIVTRTFDHRRPDFSFLEERGKVLFFTCHSIEQVDRIPANYFDLLADAADRVTCIHFEPFGFQISTTDEISKAQERYVRENNWNTNFLEVLNASGKTGKIKVAFTARDPRRFRFGRQHSDLRGPLAYLVHRHRRMIHPNRLQEFENICRFHIFVNAPNESVH